MKTTQLILQTLFLLVALANAGQNDNTTCYNDAACNSFCCSNNKDYHVEGLCEPQDLNPRCEKRKKTDITILISFYAIVVPILGMCAYVKVRQVRAHTEYLQLLRIKSIS